LAEAPVAAEPAQARLIGRKNIESVVSRPRRK
ncbi:GNAT family N-acetyltransferase, partial [Pseudomonas syringae]|nr:GNAT family N-acetyltransferase [Pseudomonas syringae]